MPTCFVTGANRGIGLEFVRQYAAEGWTIHATCRDPDAASALNGLPNRIHIHCLDVTDFVAVEALARTLESEAIDLLINNAGVYGPRVVPYDFIDYGLWAEVLRVNMMAPLKIGAVFSKHVARSQRKVIVSLTSSMGSIGENTSGGSYIYRSSKAALNAAMRSLAIDLRGKEISVVLLHPGWVRTKMGGAGAALDVSESVTSMRRLIEELTLRESGRCFAYDGSELPW